MQGIIIVDKPQGFTSFDVIAKLRGICKTKKIGHSGTLDPMATGVLPIFIGNAAKAVDMQANHDKTYVATLKLGIKTDTGDITGEVIETKPVKDVDTEKLKDVLQSFVGDKMQMPPMYSAVKINGQPLYKAARKGIEIEREKRPVTFYDVDFIEKLAEDEFTIKVSCSKGTYIRVLIEDIGTALGTVATMTALRRIQAGVYTVENAYTLEEIQTAKNEDKLESLLQNVDTVFSHLPKLNVTDEGEQKRLMCGAVTSNYKKDDGTYACYFENVFFGVVKIEEGVLSSVKNLYPQEA